MTGFNLRRGQGRQRESPVTQIPFDLGLFVGGVFPKKGDAVRRFHAWRARHSLHLAYPPPLSLFLAPATPSAAPVRALVRGWQIVLAQPVPARLSRSSDRAYEKREGALRRVPVSPRGPEVLTERNRSFVIKATDPCRPTTRSACEVSTARVNGVRGLNRLQDTPIQFSAALYHLVVPGTRGMFTRKGLTKFATSFAERTQRQDRIIRTVVNCFY